MLVEIRTYAIAPGRRDEFVEWFENRAVPAMQAVGMRIIGQFVSVDDPDSFVWMRGFESEQQRDDQYAAFYDSAAWKDRLLAEAQDLETGSSVVTVTPTAGSALT